MLKYKFISIWNSKYLVALENVQDGTDDYEIIFKILLSIKSLLK